MTPDFLLDFPDDCPIKCKKPTHVPVGFNIQGGFAEYECGETRWICWFSGIKTMSERRRRSCRENGIRVTLGSQNVT